MKHWAIILAIIILSSTWGTLQLMSHGEPILQKRPLAEFPLVIANHWEGHELGIEKDVLAILKLSDYMMRAYRPVAAGESVSRPGLVPVWLYVGYYQSQRTGATYHSPKNCLPGAGWQIVEAQQVTVPVPKGNTVTINNVLIQKGLDKQVILYWYQDRGRVIASEYSAKVYMIWDAMTKNRTDGALVRISVPVRTTTAEAYQTGVGFLQDIWPLLGDYLPAASVMPAAASG